MQARSLLAVALVSAFAYGACADHDPEQGRVGGPIPEFDASLPQECPVEAGAPVPYCDAYAAMRTCRCCHFEESEERFAPFRLFTYDDTQQSYGGQLVWQHMIDAIESDFMPLIDPCNPRCITDPPANPLEPQCKDTLLRWLCQGALPTGGTDCDPDVSCSDDIGCIPKRP